MGCTANLPTFVSAAVAACMAAAAWGRDPSRTAGEVVVVSGVGGARARLLVARAEDARREVAERFLGGPPPRSWDPPCEIHVHADRESFRAALGGGPAIAEGATSIEFAGDRVALRRIDLLDSGEGVPSALAHEMAHVVLADHFKDGPPPRWADEGLATLLDDESKQRRHEEDHLAAVGRGQAWPIRELLVLDIDPADAARQRVFYGQSASLVRWLVARRDGRTFIAFLDLAADQGVTAALRAVYGIDSPEDLEREWRASPVPPR